MKRRARRWLKPKYPTVRQYDRTDCGPASLLSVLRYHGGEASLVSVRELAHTGVHGTSMWSLREAAETLGFDASGARGTYEDLRDAALPCIAHFVLEDGRPHFVVVFRITEKKVLLGDPGRGRSWITRDTFCRRWKSQAVLLLCPTDRLRDTPSTHWLKWVFEYFRREQVWLTQALFMGITYAGLGLLTALFVRALVDRFIPSGDASRIFAVGSGLLVLQLLRASIGYLRGWLLIELSRRVNTRMTVDALIHLFKVPARFFESRRTGDITSRLNDSVRIHAALLNTLGNAAIDVVVLFGSMTLLFFLAPPFGWTAVTFVVLLSLLVTVAARHVRDQQFRVKGAYAGMQASYIDSIEAIDPIRATNSAPVFARLLGDMYDQVQRGLARLGLLQTRVSVAVELSAGALVVLALTAGSLFVVRDTMTLGTMMAAYSLLVGTVPATARIVDTHLQLQEASVASARLLDLLLVEPERSQVTTPFEMSRSLEIRSGGFNWPGGDSLFENISLEIPRGRLTAICGSSGVGKSTLIKILDRRYSLSKGELLIDDISSDHVDLISYRENVATLPEAVRIINGTIAENILLGRQVPDFQRLTERIQQLEMTRFFNRFPSGIFTLIGDDGRQISSGERQIIGLLRALWDSPEVLLVDEGMNALDMETTKFFLKTLSAYAKDHAVLSVSHQPRTLLVADYAYVLEASGIVEEGTPEDLLARGLKFATLVAPGALAAQTA